MSNMQYLVLVLTAITLSCASSEKLSEVVKGKVIHVVDGDTYDLLAPDSSKIRIRMEGIDAPEKGMPYYQVAKEYLKEKCLLKNVKIIINDTDDNGRLIAYTFLNDGSELSHEMIRAGLAWHFKKYNSDSTLAILEEEAKASKLKVWSEPHPMPPWENRRLHRNGISTKDSFDIQPGQD